MWEPLYCAGGVGVMHVYHNQRLRRASSESRENGFPDIGNALIVHAAVLLVDGQERLEVDLDEVRQEQHSNSFSIMIFFTPERLS